MFILIILLWVLEIESVNVNLRECMEIPVHRWVGWGQRPYNSLASLRCNQFRGAFALGKPMVTKVVKEFPPPPLRKPKGDFHVNKCPSLILFWARLIQPLLPIPAIRLYLFPLNMAWCRPRRQLIITGVNRYHLSCCQQLGVQTINYACTFLAANQPFIGAETYLIDEFWGSEVTQDLDCVLLG